MLNSFENRIDRPNLPRRIQEVSLPGEQTAAHRLSRHHCHGAPGGHCPMTEERTD